MTYRQRLFLERDLLRARAKRWKRTRWIAGYEYYGND